MATMNLTLKVWRQKNSQEKGRMVDYKVTNISDHMSFLEMLDVLNEQLIEQGEEPVAFDHEETGDAMAGELLTLTIDLHDGDAEAQAWGCDLSYDYVKINALYRT